MSALHGTAGTTSAALPESMPGPWIIDQRPGQDRDAVDVGGCEIEVPDALAAQHGIRELEGGAQIFAAGQLSERWEISDGKRAAIALIHPGLHLAMTGTADPSGWA